MGPQVYSPRAASDTTREQLKPPNVTQSEKSKRVKLNIFAHIVRANFVRGATYKGELSTECDGNLGKMKQLVVHFGLAKTSWQRW